MEGRRGWVPEVRTIDVPVPVEATTESLLASMLGSERAAGRAISEAAIELGLPPSASRSALAVLALAKVGGDLDLAARSLTWGDFEGLSAMLVGACGYGVRRNVRLTKPTRQIDVVGESPSLVLAIDCKHWRRSGGPSSLEAVATAQAERTRALAEKAQPARGRAYLPVVLTLQDSQVNVLRRVPVVPVRALREFLTSVNRFDDRFSFFEG